MKKFLTELPFPELLEQKTIMWVYVEWHTIQILLLLIFLTLVPEPVYSQLITL